MQTKSKDIKLPIIIAFALSSTLAISCQKEAVVSNNHKLALDVISSSKNNSATSINLNQGLVAYYQFTGNANDASGNGYNGNPLNVTLTIDRRGKKKSAYLFDKVDSYVDVSNKPIVGYGNSPRSIFAWAKTTDNTQYVRIFAGGSTSPGQSFNILLMWNGIPVFMGWHPYDFLPNSGVSITDGKWHLIGITYDGNILKTWVDGINQNTCTISLNTVGNNNLIGYPNEIGTYGVTTDHRFKGALDEFRFYNRVLTQSEITYLSTH